jgi:ParB family transcriptional regulator, chromosome partitioning protein
MELRRVDPRCLKKNPRNPRNIQPGEMSDAALAANISAIGILQPPAVTEKNGELTIAYGARRVRIAIAIGLPEIDVLVKESDDRDHMRAVSENVVRAPMATVDLWRAIESLASENWTEEAIASALAVSLRQIRKLRLLATVHPAILEQIGAGDMPKEQELRTIASALREDQAAVWKKFKPRKGEAAQWWQISQALQKTRFFARDAKFGEAEREAFGIVWQEDPFVEGDEEGRFTIDGESFVSAQRAWVDANMPKNGVWIEIDEYCREKLPPRANRTWTKPKKGDQVGFAVHPRDGKIQEVVFRISEPDATKGHDRPTDTEDDTRTQKKPRPEITQKGTEIIGALRTEALVKSLEVNACDDMTLIGLLVLALDARNVSVRTDRPTHSTRTKLVQSITEGGRLTHDTERLRVVARQMLANVLSCSIGRSDSGLVARIAGNALGADPHIGNMGAEDFLSCLSKTGIEKVGSSLGVLPRPRAKDTRAEVLK